MTLLATRLVAQFKAVLTAVAGLFQVIFGYLGWGPAWAGRKLRKHRLDSLEKAASEDPKDAAKVASYLAALLQTDPKAVVKWVDSKDCAMDSAVAIEYLKALVVSNEIARFYLSDSAEGQGASSKRSLPQLLQNLYARMGGEARLGGEAVVGGEAAGATGPAVVVGGDFASRPLHVVVSKKPVGFLQWLGSTMASALSTIFMLAIASFIWLFGISIIRRHSAGSTQLPTAQSSVAVSSGDRGASTLAPKEYSKENLPEGAVKTFSDVLGCDEAKAELEEVVAFLKNPAQFTKLGGKLPKGVLLTGPPGTGKTLLAKATAGEAGVPFLFRSGSEFEEMFVGVGARRVRNLFNEARKKAPCIVFIDELDAIGGSRKDYHNHNRKTLNQLLTEMDGFDSHEGVIVMGCTNIPEDLDKALTRPGRFDRIVPVPLPDVKGRAEILSFYLKEKPIAPGVDAKLLARQTPGFSGAELFNLVNEAALLAAKRGSNQITPAIMEEARDKVIMGAPRASALISQESRRTTAYHEAGHALVALHTPGAIPIHKATIVPRGNALGMVTQVPEKDETDVTKQQLRARIDVCMGGRVAEELIFGEDNVTTGALSDLQQATSMARNMVAHWGMSDELGPMFVSREFSSDVHCKVDAEVARVLKSSYGRVRDLLGENESQLHTLASALLEHETLTQQQIKDVLKGIPLLRDAPSPAGTDSSSSSGSQPREQEHVGGHEKPHVEPAGDEVDGLIDAAAAADAPKGQEAAAAAAEGGPSD